MALQDRSESSHPIFAIATAAAPLLGLAATIAFLVNGEGSQNNGEVGGAIQVWAYIAYAVSIVGLTSLLAPRAPRAAMALLVTGLAGAGGGIGYGIDAIQAAVFSNDSIQDTSTAAAPFALQLPGIMFPFTLFALAIALYRTRLAPSWVAFVLAAGAALFPLGNIPDIDVLVVMSAVVLVTAGLSLSRVQLGLRADPTPAFETSSAP